MTSTVQNTRSMISDIKVRLRTETNQEKRYKLAIWGEELNQLLRELQDTDPPMKYCKYCNKEKAIHEFGFTVTTYKSKKGIVKTIKKRRHKCKTCTNRPYQNKRVRDKDFNWIF